MNSVSAPKLLLLLAMFVVGLDCFMTYNFHKPITFEKFRQGNGAAVSVNRRQASNLDKISPSSSFRTSFERPPRSYRVLPRAQDDVDLINIHTDNLYYPYAL